MKRSRKEKTGIVILAGVLLCVSSTGCSTTGLAQESTFESSMENTQEEPVDIYVSELNGVVRNVNKEEQQITVCSLTDHKEQSISYDAATVLTDPYGAPLTVDQLTAGSIVRLAYNSTLNKAGSLQLDPDAWSNTGIEKFHIDTEAGTLTIGQEEYRLNTGLLVFSGQKEILPEQLLQQDVISVRGIGDEVFSITVDRGHGYLELENEEYFVDGWIEIGQTLISRLSPDMLFSVPEGTYQVRLTTELLDESREVTICRDEVTELDLGDVEKPIPESGQVTLQITPEDAQVYIDDHLINAYYTMKLPLGIHEITVSASGYDTVSQYFEVDGEPLLLEMSLPESKSTASVSGNDVSWASTDRAAATITIAAPEGAEVYEDNLYKGYAPVTYTKTAGTHVITLRKTGYVTSSYSIEVKDDDENVTYSFPELVQESSSVSGNSVSATGSVAATQTAGTAGTASVSGNSISGNSVSANSVN